MIKLLALALMFFLATTSAIAQEAPMGSPVKIKKKFQKQMDALKGQINGKIVWSTSRSNSKHDLWIMNADGSDAKALTKSDHVDWFPRISPDGKKVLFTRSKGGWVPETDAKYPDKWDIYSINIDGSDLQKIVEGAVWGTWHDGGNKIVYAKANKAFIRSLEAGSSEELLFDGNVLKEGTIVQEPNLSPDGKYLAATLRGTSRETGIWNIEAKKWETTGGGCQIDWFPGGKKIYRVNPTGNGGTAAPSEILHIEVENGAPKTKVSSLRVPKEIRFMDLPGRLSHEYFPKLDNTGKYMVWCATSKGHDHDIYDYEVFIWKIGEKAKKAVRLTFHTGNDRWPDLYVYE